MPSTMHTSMASSREMSRLLEPEGDEQGGELDAKAGHGEHADDDAADGGGSDNGGGADGAGAQGIHQLFQGEAVVLIEAAAR